MSPPDLTRRAQELLPDIVALRRRLHAWPELGLELPKTRDAVLEALAGLGLEIEAPGRTSAVVARLQGGRPGRTLLLRADMDALPLQEDTGLPFASQVDGAMHACGHDAHVAMLAGAARLLAERREELAGSVKLVFQPGEEGHAGARVLIEEGLLDGVDGAFAIHVNPMLRAGAVALRAGAMLAAGDVFSIDLKGRGGHASEPHHTRDPIPVACEIVTALQTMVTRRLYAFDPVVLTVTKIQAGSALNVIPESAQVQGTFRSVSDRARRRVGEQMRRLVEGIAAAHEIEAAVYVIPGYPPTLNDTGFTDFARRTARDLVGTDAVVEMDAPVMGTEDFSYVLRQAPGAMVFLGVQPEGGRPHALHSNRMVLEESELATGAALHAAVALGYLGGGEGA